MQLSMKADARRYKCTVLHRSDLDSAFFQEFGDGLKPAVAYEPAISLLETGWGRSATIDDYGCETAVIPATPIARIARSPGWCSTFQDACHRLAHRFSAYRHTCWHSPPTTSRHRGKDRQRSSPPWDALHRSDRLVDQTWNLCSSISPPFRIDLTC